MRILRPLLIGFLLFSGLLRATGINVVLVDNRFGLLDDTSGAFTSRGTVRVESTAGMGGRNGFLYLEDFQNNLFRVDPLAGSATLIGNTGLDLSMAAFGGDNAGFFAVDFKSDLYSIDSENGRATRIGATGLSFKHGAKPISMVSDGLSLYFLMDTSPGNSGGDSNNGNGQKHDNSAALYRIDIATGATSFLGSTGVANVASAAVVNGKLELYQSGAGGSIYAADVGSLNFKQVSRLGSDVSAAAVLPQVTMLGTLTTPVSDAISTPEPTTAWFLVLGCAAVGVRRITRGRFR